MPYRGIAFGSKNHCVGQTCHPLRPLRATADMTDLPRATWFGEEAASRQRGEDIATRPVLLFCCLESTIQNLKGKVFVQKCLKQNYHSQWNFLRLQVFE